MSSGPHPLLFQSVFFLSLLLGPLFYGAVDLWAFCLVVFLASAAFLATRVQTLRTSRGSVLGTPLDKVLGVYAVVFLLSAFFSKVPALTGFECYKLLGVILVFYATLHLCRSRMDIYQLAQWLVFVGALLSFGGLLQFIGGLPKDWWSRSHFLSSTYVNHNHFAGLLVLLIPVALGLTIAERSRAKKSLLIFLTSVMGAAFIFTLSRGGCLALAAALVLMTVMFGRLGLIRSSLPALLVLAALVIGSVIAFGTTPIEKRVADIKNLSQEEELSMEYRWRTWQGTLPLIAERPFLGSGPGTFDVAFLRYRPAGFNHRPVYAHNDFLHLLAECGILGFLACLAIVVTFFRKGWEIVLRDDSRLRVGLGSGILAGVAGLLVHGLVDFNFHIPANWLMTSVLAGLLFSQGETRKVSVSAQRPAQAALFVGLLSAMVGALVMGGANYYRWEARELYKDGDALAASESSQKSIHLYPADPEAYFLKGLARRDVTDLDRAIALNPYEPVYELWRARVLAPRLAEQSPEEWVAQYRRALAKDPQNALLYSLSGKDLLEWDKQETPILRGAAKEWFKKAIELDASFSEDSYARLWMNDRSIAKILSFHERVGERGLDGFVRFLEKHDLWKIHRKYHLDSLGLDAQARRDKMESISWNERTAQSWKLNDLKPSAGGPVNLDDFFFANGELSRDLSFSGGPLRLTLYAKGSAVKNTYPALYVKIDGRLVDEHYMDTKTFKNYYTLLEAEPGTHRLSLQYVNDSREKAASVEDRNIWISRIEIEEPLGG